MERTSQYLPTHPTADFVGHCVRSTSALATLSDSSPVSIIDPPRPFYEVFWQATKQFVPAYQRPDIYRVQVHRIGDSPTPPRITSKTRVTRLI